MTSPSADHSARGGWKATKDVPFDADKEDVTPATDIRDGADHLSGAATAAGASSRREAGALLDGLRGSIAPPAISPLYRLGMAACSRCWSCCR